MDLLQTIRKEGSRGGRSEFSWQEVQNDPQRQNYLGHSLMAPVGRWQKGKDLNWYARGEGDDSKEIDEATQRREEMRKIKEREEDEMLKALGMPVPDRSNANLEPVVMRDGMGKLGGGDEVEVDKKEVVDKRRRSRSRSRERRHRRDDRSRSRERKHHRRRSRSRDGERERRHRSRREGDGRRHGREDEEHEHRHRHRHRHSDHTGRPRSVERRRHRSRSPNERRDRDRDYEGRRRHD